MNFEDAVAPVDDPRATTANPFREIVAAIAGKKNEGGKPVAKSFTFEHPDDPEYLRIVVQRYKRQLAEAGNACNPPVTVRPVTQPVKLAVKGKKIDPNDPSTYTVSKTETQLVFWTLNEKIRRPKKAKTNTDETSRTASSPQTDAVTQPNTEVAPE